MERKRAEADWLAAIAQVAHFTHDHFGYNNCMVERTSDTRISTWLAGLALAAAALSLLLHWPTADVQPSQPRVDASSDPNDRQESQPNNTVASPVAASRDNWSDLADRIARLEDHNTGAKAEFSQRTNAAQPVDGVVAKLAALEVRVANLESQQEKERATAAGLVAPDAITSTLAVLLAARGVVTKVGDVEALQANIATLGQIVADGTAKDWDRIEAYRGMLTFGFESPEVCKAAMPHLASLLLTSADEKARKSAAGMLQTAKNPRIAGTLMAAYERETSAAVRASILQTLRNYRDDPSVRQTLQSALKRERDPTVIKLIRTALSK